MKHEQVGILLKALHGVYADDDLTKSERGESCCGCASRLSRTHGARDGLKDIASIPAAIDEPDLTKADTASCPCDDHSLKARLRHCARSILRSLASRRSAASTLTRSNAEIAKIERAANEARFVEQATSQSGDNIEKRAAHRQARQRPWRPQGQGRRASQGQALSFPNRRLSPRSTKTRPIGRWLPPSGSRARAALYA